MFHIKPLSWVREGQENVVPMLLAPVLSEIRESSLRTPCVHSSSGEIQAKPGTEEADPHLHASGSSTGLGYDEPECVVTPFLPTSLNKFDVIFHRALMLLHEPHSTLLLGS